MHFNLYCYCESVYYNVIKISHSEFEKKKVFFKNIRPIYHCVIFLQQSKALKIENLSIQDTFVLL